MMKVMFGCGVYCMFRGQEHASFCVNQIKFGHYPCSFEHAQLAGHPYVSISNLTDKTHQITVNNSYSRDTTDSLRFPINQSDPADFSASLQRLLEKLGPGQVRVYCRPVSAEYIACTYRRHGNTKSLYYPKSPLGMNSIRNLMASGAAILGISPNFRPHSLRAVGVTKLANNSSISDAERCRAARHATVNVNRAYQTVDGRSEANRLLALGVTLPSPISAPEGIPPFQDKKQALMESVDEVQGASKMQVLTQEEEVEFVDISACVSTDSVCSDVTEPCLKIHRKPEEQCPRQSLTQCELDKLKQEFSELQDLIVEKKKTPEPPVSLTQVGIDNLKEEIGQLKGLVGKKRKVPVVSPNQAAIKVLQEQVKKLKDDLEYKELYCDSLENDFFSPQKKMSNRRDSDFREVMYKNRQLERENEELFNMINRGHSRDTRSRYRDY
jgi:hypothetical protein